MEKILVQWCDGRSKGTTSFVKRSAVKAGTIAVGNRVVVTWGKTKKGYNAEVVSVRSEESSAATRSEESSAAIRSEESSTATRSEERSTATTRKETPAATRREEVVPFTFELAAPAQRSTPR